MPKIYEYFGYIFYFWSNEHDPVHVHVKKGERETIYEIILENGKLSKINKRKDKNVTSLTEKEDKEAYAFVEKFALNIVEKWVNYFVYNKKIRSSKISKRV